MTTVDVPMEAKPNGNYVPLLGANDRMHWSVKAQRTAEIRAAVAWRVKALRLPAQEHITVTLHYEPATRRRMDASNLMPTAKAAVDGLRDAGLVPDDDGRYVTERMPIIHPPKRPGRMWLDIEPKETT